MFVCERACVRAYICVCVWRVCECVRECVRACVRVCVACLYELKFQALFDFSMEA